MILKDKKLKIKKITKIKKNPKKAKKVLPLGLHKRLVMVFWGILISSVLFGVYKNFTAINKHTIHEKEVIEMKVVDTSNIQSFVSNFANVYYTWTPNKEVLETRTEQLQSYLSEELQQLNSEMIREDIPTSASVENVQFWNISEKEEHHYMVLFSVDQIIVEGDSKKRISTCYELVVYVDEEGDMVIIQNPTISKQPEKAEYELEKIESDGSIDGQEIESINEFLETFFTLYPSASQKELTYYVSNHALQPIEKDYVFAELLQPVYRTIDGQIHVNVTVKYLDNGTKTNHFAQYHLVLENNGNWKIIKAN